MTDLATSSRRDPAVIPPRGDSTAVTLRTPAGQGLISLDAVPAVATLTAALVIAPRATALAAIGALMLRMSISIDGRRWRSVQEPPRTDSRAEHA